MIARPRRFKEPGSGLFMVIGLYYTLSDSGACYSGRAFDTVMVASEYLEACHDVGPLQINYPEFKDGDWTQPWGVANVVKADDLWSFWLRTDPAQLRESNVGIDEDYFR